MVVLVNNSRSLLSFKRVRIGVSLILAIVASTALLTPLQGETRVKVYSQAVQAKQAGDYQESLRLFNSLLESDPENASLTAEIEELNRLVQNQGSSATAPASTEGVTSAVPGNSTVSIEATPAPVATPAAVDPIEASLEARRQADAAREAQARALLATGLEQYQAGEFQAAQATLDNARAIVPQNSRTESLSRDIDSALRNSILDLALFHAERGNQLAANTETQKYAETFGRDSNLSRVERSIQAISRNPAYRDIERISPGYTASREQIQSLLTDAKAQYQAGDLGGSRESFRRVQMLDPNNAEAKWYIGQIADVSTSTQNRVSARKEMLKSITDGWLKPGVFEDLVDSTQQVDTSEGARDRIKNKLDSIIIPQVSFTQGVRLSDIVETLSELSVEYDNSQDELKGVNIIFIPPADGSDPVVPISLRRLSLGRILDYVAEIAQFEVEIREDTVAVIKGADGSTGGPTLSTEIFQIDSATKLRMTGVGGGSGGTQSSSNPFEQASSGGGGDADDDSTRIKTFLQRAGIDFTVQGANLVYDGAAIIVTNLPRNIERVGQLLRRYEQANMIEIETKFLEVNANDLDEIGFDWTLNRFARTAPDGSITYDETYRSGNRSLDSAFSSTPTSSSVIYGGNVLDSVLPPAIPGTLDLAAGVPALGSISSVMGKFDANLVIRAINRKSGTDLMSAPKVTVISGKRAEIVVAQEFPYPEDYDRPEVEVGRGGSDSSTGSAGNPAVAITSGTPQNFVTRNVGVTLGVQPRVEQGNRIAMVLNPEITEFEGFVEYGGRNIALLGNTQLIAPTGYFKPIFSVRKIDTEVTIWDGATLVMGGLMREEVVRVKDKVPVLGDLPLLGFLFRSEGESSNKRNLLIFVTGNLISYGGSPSRQSLPGLERATPFSNPVLVTPGGDIYRGSGN